MFNKRNIIILLLTFIFSILLIGCGASDDAEVGSKTNSVNNDLENEEVDNSADLSDEFTIRFAHEEGQGDVQDLYVNKFKEAIEEETDGRITVDVYTAGQLGTNMDVLKAIETGAIDFSISSPGFSGDIIPETQIMSIPFLFSDKLEVNKKVLDESEALYGILSEKYEEKGLKPLKFWLEGTMWWTANKSITTPEEMKGFKVRTMPTSLIIESYNLIGANPTPLDSGEIYTMLQTKGIDGQENPLFYIYNSNFHEVQDYLMDSRHHIYTTVTVANSDYFESLSEEDQTIITDIIQEVNDWSFTMQDEERQKALDKLLEEDIEIVDLTTEQREVFRELSLPVRDKYVDEVGEDAKRILEIIENDIEAAEKELSE